MLKKLFSYFLEFSDKKVCSKVGIELGASSLTCGRGGGAIMEGTQWVYR